MQTQRNPVRMMTPTELAQKVTLEILSEDRNLITYRPLLNKLTGSITATVLLQQILFLWKNNKRRPFYKFNAPCDHKAYKSGDSFCEELGMNRREFENARDAIATKFTQELAKTKTKDQAAEESLVLYWTDANRLTWYQVNEAKLDGAIVALYSGESLMYETYISKCTKPTLANVRNVHYPNTETLTETLTETSLRAEERPRTPLSSGKDSTDEAESTTEPIVNADGTVVISLPQPVQGKEVTRNKRASPPRRRSADKAGVGQMLPHQQAMVGVLARVLEEDTSLPGVGSRLGKWASALLNAGYLPEQVESAFGKGGWWYKRHWLGKQGRLPHYANILRELPKAVKGINPEQGNGKVIKPPPSDEEHLLAALRLMDPAVRLKILKGMKVRGEPIPGEFANVEL